MAKKKESPLLAFNQDAYSILADIKATFTQKKIK